MVKKHTKTRTFKLYTYRGICKIYRKNNITFISH
ncbi:hypothetical protein AAS23_gp28 [Pantoea phage vB_PagS_AAS23]|uniref:Uncharacterized protein n=1 Tax=Pantoea phage vB_PagS_AAS23 TaxID=2499073 RepID=A0A3S9U7P6_9CAUD|nr:hypothetical protein HOU93_gp28 [Pantoea phage vB_PagS_AAS23]AZS06341.1 hypothetical protein AAS23_gp28 [Pantoea phage vB_PagS_AAS23]